MTLDESGCQKSIDQNADTEQFGQKAPSQSLFNVKHGTAVEISLFVNFSVMDSQCDLCGFCHHS